MIAKASRPSPLLPIATLQWLNSNPFMNLLVPSYRGAGGPGLGLWLKEQRGCHRYL